jgi:hypothetical protein
MADGPCTVWTLSRSGLSRLAEDSPRAAFRLVEALAGELVALVRPGIEVLIENANDLE